MVGGFATRFHGFNRSTDDLDMWLEDTIENRVSLRTSFSELGYGDYSSLETMPFVPGWTSFYIGGGIELDIMTSMKDWKMFLSANVSIWLQLPTSKVLKFRFCISIILSRIKK